MSGEVFAIPSEMEMVPELCEQLRAAMSAQGIADSDAIQIEICVAEAVNNAIEHGYRGDPGQLIEVETELDGGRLHLEIRDRGPAFDPTLSSVDLDDFDPKDVASIPERGRGIAIIRAVMSEVRYQRCDRINRLRMTRVLEDAPSGGHQSETSARGTR